MSAETITAQELYSLHKQRAREYQEAKSRDLPPDNAAQTNLRRTIERIDRIIELAPDDVDKGSIQNALEVAAKIKQNGILEPKLAEKAIRIDGARARFEISNIIAAEVFRLHGAAWYEEAKAEMNAALNRASGND